MEYLASPSYTHEKLENPSYSDLVDVFEDSWNMYIFKQVSLLMKSKHGEVAAVTVLCSYYEAIQSYIIGESSNRKSRDFFVNGFLRVFSSKSLGIEKAAQEIYTYIRCGLAHEGMLRNKVNYSRAGEKVFFITYPKNPDGSLNVDADATSIILNPVRMHEATEQHFNNYLKQLRASEDKELGNAFHKTVEREWALDNGENIVGMTEAEFRGNA